MTMMPRHLQVKVIIRSGALLFSMALLVLMLLPAARVTAQQENLESAELKVSPQRCVTLREGQRCYVKLRFEWLAPSVEKACVYRAESTLLQCWTEDALSPFVIPLTLSEDTDFLLLTPDGTLLGTVQVTVSWVYRKKRSRRRWRLF